MNDRDAFLRTIIAAPDDDAPRLVYADWLEENGEPERAEFIRVQIELIKTKRCESARHGIPCPYNWCRGCALRRRERELLFGPFHSPNVWEWIGPCNELLIGAGEALDAPTTIASDGEANDNRVQFRRGFIERITCNWSDWLTHHRTIMAATPLQWINWTTEPDLYCGAATGNTYTEHVAGSEPILIDREVYLRELRKLWPSIKSFNWPPPQDDFFIGLAEVGSAEHRQIVRDGFTLRLESPLTQIEAEQPVDPSPPPE